MVEHGKMRQITRTEVGSYSFATLLACVWSIGSLPAQEENEKSLVLRKEAAERIRAIKLMDVSRGNDVRVDAIEKPLLRFGDPARANEDGTLWAWGSSGRPLAMMELYRTAGDTVRWTHAVTLTSTRLVTADTDGGRWSPQKTQLSLQPVPNAPVPKDKPGARLRQMKQLARKLEAHEFWKPDNSRYLLRLLVSPVHRYSNEKSGIVDGTVFVFAHGTNPEIIVFIEAQKSKDSLAWHYGFARLGSAELHVSLEGKEVWTQPRAPKVIGGPRDPYWIFFATTDVSSDANEK